ncbi:hypothetical protein FVEG_05815 [Fusarium verticillioides 7600]|uniref:Uncharacterized protein n=1 Tax=Gibberella moniliformis (strain M3125 / FGSC 7600) TaxID=334819 RepID=W7MIX1_GIBM7|nr:hypothetical protein FVEG_05815 [Fusarium verticillioides 7600]EWG44837.1 hypothetical protein FVEG_05815 [Fusarium verticillioides 7600]RBQ74549.1 hypothetical protein FVER14953_05815 [Fusarium verticillioides]
MIRICLLLFALAVCAVPIKDTAAQTLDFCGQPDKSNYTLIQNPFLGDLDIGQPGITLETAYGDGTPRWFMVYQNGMDVKPYRAMKVSSNTTVFVDLTTWCPTFSGRLVRGNYNDFDGGAHNLGTWAEVNWQSYPLVYGGVSVIEGNDGPILLQSEDPNTPSRGFTEDIIPRAPKECRVKKDSGGMALKPTDKDGYDEVTRKFTKRQLDNHKVSIDKTYIATVMSHNGRFKIVFLHGNH